MLNSNYERSKSGRPLGEGRQCFEIGKATGVAIEDILVSVEDAARLCGESVRTIRDRCAKGKYLGTITVPGNGGEQYRIPLSSLPDAAQFNYYAEQARKDSDPEAQRARVKHLNALALEKAREDAAAGRLIRKEKLLPIPLNDEESAALWERWDQASEGQQKEARRRFEVLQFFEKLRNAHVNIGTIEKEFEKRYDVSPATLWRWRKLVAGQHVGDWLPLLLPNWKGRTAQAEFTEEAWTFILTSWLVPSKPSIASVYRRAQERAPEEGWVLPSLDVVEKRINDLPKWLVVLGREGEKALKALYPSQKRDYTTLQVHDIWCADGRTADVFCRWTHPDGSTSIGRPIVVGWLDVRTRYLLGFEIGRTESADLIRLAFKNALEQAGVIPDEALMDNGRGFASKLLTGGAPNRFRFKVKEEDVPGILICMGINPVWATPGHGQAKPIESFWRVLAELDKRAEFRGAYVGNRPDARPEEWDPKKAIPIEVYRDALIKEINAYNRRGHRGDGMNGRSPLEVYTELLESAPPRKQSTAQQLRLCLLAAEAVKLDKKDHSVRILGNRYWDEALAGLDERRTYTVRFNPENASEPVYVYDGTRFICEARIIEKTGFRDREAAKAYNRARNKTIKSQKTIAAALKEMHQAEIWAVDGGLTVDIETGEILEKPPRPKAAELFRTNVEQPQPTQEKADTGQSFRWLGKELGELRRRHG